MKRYQVYLNQNSVSVIDDFEKYANISRSRLISATVDRLAENLARIFVTKNIAPQDKYILDSLVGFLSSTNKKKTDFASKTDDIYFKD